MEAKICPDGSAVGRTGPACSFAPCPDGASPQAGGEKTIPEKSPDASLPLSRASERVTKKAFGTFITPENSPVQPERFRGYHTGTDFETFPEEAASDVSIRAICDGALAMKRSASGYGGVAVQKCAADNAPVTVVYGHLRLASIRADIGDDLKTGDVIGVLGTGDSRETDGERKHLHLGIHRGSATDIRGYVASQAALEQWIDPCQFLSLGSACSL